MDWQNGFNGKCLNWWGWAKSDSTKSRYILSINVFITRRLLYLPTRCCLQIILHIGILKCLVCWVFCLIIDACTSWQWLQTNCMVLSSPKVKISLLKIILDQPCISSNVLHAFGLFYTGQFLHYFSGIIQTCMGQLIFVILQKGMSQMMPCLYHCS